MEHPEKYTEKLAKYILIAAGVGLIGGICWYFSSVLIYILLAVVVSLVAQPVMTLLRKIRIKGKHAPDWLLTMLTLIVLMTVFLAVITMIVPIVSGIIKGIKEATYEINGQKLKELKRKMISKMLRCIPRSVEK